MGIIYAIKDYWDSLDELQEQIDKFGEGVMELMVSGDRDKLLKQYGALESTCKEYMECAEKLTCRIDEVIG